MGDGVWAWSYGRMDDAPADVVDGDNAAKRLGRQVGELHQSFWTAYMIVAMCGLLGWGVFALGRLIATSATKVAAEPVILVFASPLCAAFLAATGVLLGAVRFGMRLLAEMWRCVRRSWWLRLTEHGIEINDRVLRPRVIRWSDVAEFMVVAQEPPDQDATTEYVGYRCTTPVVDKWWAVWTPLRNRVLGTHWDRRGVRADGVLGGWWDRDADLIVALLDDWLLRHRGRHESDDRGAAGQPIV